MSEETARELIGVLKKLTTALNTIGRPMTRKEIQETYDLGRDAVNAMFNDPEFKTQTIGKKRFATREAVNCYFQKTQTN